MGTQGDTIPDDIKQETEPLQTIQEKIVKKTFQRVDEERIFPEKPFDQNSRVLNFHIRPKVDRIMNPSQMYLNLKISILQEDGTPFNKPDDVTMPQAKPHARFDNPFGSSIVEKIEIKPMRGDDIELTSEHFQLEEKLRWYLQNNKKEKKHVEGRYVEGNWYRLARFNNNLMCNGQTYDDTDFKDAAEESLEYEILTADYRYHNFKIPLASAFNEIKSYLPGMWEFNVVIHLAHPYKAIMVRNVTANGFYNTNQGPVSNKPKYVLEPNDTFLVIKYAELFDSDKEEFKNAFYGFKNIKLECFHGIRVLKSLPFSDGQKEDKIIDQEFQTLQGVWPKRFFICFMRSSEFDSQAGRVINSDGNLVDAWRERYSAEPFNIESVDILQGEHSVFRKPIKWVSDMENDLTMWRRQADMTAEEFDYENRYNPFSDIPAHLKYGKWFAYVDLTEEPGTKFSEVTSRVNANFSIRVKFTDVTNPANVNRLVCVIFYKVMPIHECLEGVTNRWARKSTYGTPIETPDRTLRATRSNLFV